MAKIDYKIKVTGLINKEYYKDILISETSTPNLRKEIRRVFQQANRRIQNIESKNYVSPALNALKEQRNLESGFSKFSISKLKDWNDIKIAYSQAVEFLKKPTSTALGARTFERQIIKENRLRDSDVDILRRYFANEILNKRERNYVENYLAKYTDVIETYKAYYETDKQQIQNAENKMQNLENLMREAGKDVTKDVTNNIDKLIAKFDFFTFKHDK